MSFKIPISLLVVAEIVLAGHPCLLAQSVATRSSPSFEVLDAPSGLPAGGGVVANGTGTIHAQISLGDAADGVPGSVTALGVQSKPNLIGQLVEPVQLEVSAVPATVNERETRQLTAIATMDDETTLPLAPDQIDWSETSAAIAAISSGGLATAASVYQDEIATVHGGFHGLNDPDGFHLTVLNANRDDFEAYAADGIDDDWQVDWFGLPPNPDAAAAADPDADQQDNHFEFLSGFSPLDPASRFRVTVIAVDQEGGSADLRLNRVIPGRLYTLKASPDLIAPFEAIGTLPAVGEPETDRIIRDASAPSGRRFYLIDISIP